jgi:1-acyl-sn-glycerol-3-phosphate acyltransferase
MRKIIAFFLKKRGWKIVLKMGIPAKCILCVAPHTSNWDFVIAISLYKSIGGNPRFLMKKDWFFFPFGNLFRYMGGIPVNRDKKNSLTQQMVELFKKKDQLQLAIAPEGTRKQNSSWKTGFYHIALAAHIPIPLIYIDYGKREIGMEQIFHPSGNAEKDIQEIKDYYKNIQAKHPEKFSI